MVLAGEDFEVRDAKTGEDLTRSILLQIILEEESGGVPMFTTQMLSQIIRFYGHAMQGVMGSMLEKNMQMFVDCRALLNQSKGLYDPKHLSPEAWTQFLSGQAPVLQNLMGTTPSSRKRAVRADAGRCRRHAVPGHAGLSAGQERAEATRRGPRRRIARCTNRGDDRHPATRRPRLPHPPPPSASSRWAAPRR
jgi:polyhydroxyalkanoate synthesis repressor PhaR